MRQIFSSARLENVEGVAELLREHGIETRITNGRSYHGQRRRQFSYRDNVSDAQPWARLWIVYPDDQLKARALLREAGLLETTRDTPYTMNPASLTEANANPRRLATRLRLGLLIIIIVLAGLTGLRGCQRPGTPVSAPPAAPQIDPQPDDDPDRHIVPVDTSLL